MKDAETNTKSIETGNSIYHFIT